MDSQAPKVLLITAYRWPSTARLAHALSEAGLTVEAVCPFGHSLTRMTCVTRSYRYGAMSPLRHLRSAITESGPDLIIPGDDTSASQLHELYRRAADAGSGGDKIRSLIARSLGNPVGYPNFYSRAQIAAIANAASVLSPETTNLHSHSDLLDQLVKVGLPAVLKVDGSFGGMGVEVVHTRAEAERAFTRLSSYNSSARTLKRLMVDSDANLVLPLVRRARPQISIQRFLTGRPANSAVACWRGTLLAQVCVEVAASRGATGPATIVNVIEHSGMSQAVERLVGELGLSGLCGFDFVLDSTDGSAHLIDFNPRATQTCHLISSERTQPTLWLAAKLRGTPPVVEDHMALHRGPITLFPHCLKNFSEGHDLTGADPSSKSPELLKIGLEFHRRNDRFLARAVRLAQGILG